MDFRFIQEWVGHESIETLQRYTNVSNTIFIFKNLPDDMHINKA